MELDPETVIGRVRRFVEARDLVLPGALVVAVSGGQDSVCLLDVLDRLREELRLDLHVAHLNHRLRVEAESEAEQVRRLVERRGLPITVAAIDVPTYRARHRLSSELAARYARYQFLAALAGAVGAEQVATGHTGDDAVETIMLNLLRGTGLAGLGGIAPRRSISPAQLGPCLASDDWGTGKLPPPPGPLPAVVRPLLELFRVETEGYCRARELAFARDPSNVDTAYRRNWLRAEVLPLLERHVPSARERLRSAADLLADEYGVVASAVAAAWDRLARVEPGRVEFALGDWRRLETPLRRHLLRRALETLVGSLEDFGRVHVDASEAVIGRGQVGARADLPRGVSVEKGYTSFWLERAEEASSGRGAMAEVAPALLGVPGSVTLPEGTLAARLLEGGEWGPPGAGGCWEAHVDADLVGPELLVRRRQPGDRFVPLGMAAPKKLQDFLVDEKVPRREREAIPLVATPDGRIVWVVGFRIDDRFKITAETRRVVELRVERR